MNRFMKIHLFLIILVLIACEDSPFYPSESLRQVPVMDFLVDTDDYVLFLANRTNNLRIPAKIIYEDTVYIAEIRATGGGSRYDPRISFRVVLKQETPLAGLTEFTLSAQVNDPTMIHTAVTSHLYRRAGFPVFDNRHIYLRINNSEIGLYVMVEVIKEPFFIRRQLPLFELYKLGRGSDFQLEESAEIPFIFSKQFPDDDHYESLLEFIYRLERSPVTDLRSNLQRFLDVDQYLEYHALTSLLNNVDAFTNNFHLASADALRGFMVVPWDFDTSFNRSKDAGLYGRNAIIDKLLQNQEILAAYKDQLTLYLTTIFTPVEIFPVIDSTAAYIEDAYNLDPYLGKGRYVFEDEINDLKSYIFNRRGFFISNLDSLSTPEL